MTFTVELGGRSWDLAPLPWRLCREIQPAILDFQDAVHAAANPSIEQFDNLMAAVFVAIRFVDKDITVEQIAELPFGRIELLKAMRPVALASGLKFGDAEGASPDEGKAEPTGPA